MNETEKVGGPKASMGRMLLASVVLSLVLGAGAGYAASSLAHSRPAPATREFTLLGYEVNFNDTAVGIPHYVYIPDKILVNEGDTVVLHFYNTADEPDSHTFTSDAPYAQDVQVDMGQHKDITFVASAAGVFPFHCRFHAPTMTGELLVIG